ncbi:MAG TPA: cell division protein FtsA [Oligoflexia bacterium]|nr:cell division protein FtsA [Oligoflexia bacterium]
MARTPKKDFIVGLDIGTTKICAIVGEVTESGVDIVGIGSHPSTGLRKGVVINIESTVESIRKAIDEAELMAGCKITSVYAGIAGGHIKSFNSHGIVAVRNKEITQEDVNRVLDAARAVAIPMDREVLHVVPQEYIIDDQDGIKEPIGMNGVRLESKVHIVTGAISSAQNIVKSCNKAGLNVAEIVLEPIASAEAVLTQDERELGVVLVDIGGGTSDIALFSQGSLVHTGVLAVGGNHITNDIAVGLRTPQNEAEKLKVRYGCAMSSLVKSEDTIEVQSVGGRKPRTVPRKLLAEIIEPRVEEIFSLVQREVQKSGYQELMASGIVITGGSTILEGMPELAEFIFDMPVKRALPMGVGGLKDVVNSPKYSTGVGLLKYAMRKQMGSKGKFPIRMSSTINAYEKVRASMSGWIKDLF